MNFGGRMFLYHLALTDEADRLIRGSQETNISVVVCAANSKQARALTAGMAIDEPEETWLSGRYSTCRRIGEVTAGANRKARVICADNSAW